MDPGIDTGDIISHVQPKFEHDDDVHTIGCKVIEESVTTLIKIIEMVKKGKELQRIKQWNVPNSRYYKNNDFNEEILKKYKQNLENGLIANYLAASKNNLKLVSIEE